MKRLGSTYKVVGVFNPLGSFFPARVYPVYKLLKDPSGAGELYTQIYDAQGKVEDYLKINSTNNGMILLSGSKSLLGSINQDAVYGFALSEEKVFLVKGLDEYKKILRSAINGGMRRLITAKPISGIEISRIIGDDKLEAVFSSFAVLQLSRKSVDVARGWLKNAPLSESARSRGELTLKRLGLKEEGKAFSSVAVETIAVSLHIYFQGELVGLFSNGKIKIKIGEFFYSGWPSWNFGRKSLDELFKNDIERIRLLELINKVGLINSNSNDDFYSEKIQYKFANHK